MNKPLFGPKVAMPVISFLLIAVVYLLINSFIHNEKIVYVESNKILAEYKGAQEAKKAYEAKGKVWQQNIETLTNDVRTGMQNYEKGLATMTDKEKNLSKQLIDTKQRQLADYQKAIQQNAQEENGRLIQGVVAQINEFLLRYGKQHHYKLILIANQAGTIAYAEDGMDITKLVIDKLNEEYKSNGK